MRRSITILAASVLALAAAASGTAAQDDPTALHPMIGTWLIQPTETDPPELFIASADGIVVSAGAEATGYGAWAATGERTADVKFLTPMLDPDAGLLGFVTIRADVEFAEDGQRLAGTWTVEFPPEVAEAMGVPAGELGPGDVSGTRIAAEPMGEVVGPLPEMAEQAPAD